MSREQEDAFIVKANFISSGKETVKIFLILLERFSRQAEAGTDS